MVLDQSLAPYERIDASEERLKAGSKSCIGRLVFSDIHAMKRRAHLLGLCTHELITAEELAGFSEETQDWIKHCLADREVHGIEDLDAE